MSIRIDDVDKTILEMLQEDSRVALRKIAEKLSVSEATIFVRVKKLREKGVIKRFTVDVSPELLGKGLVAFVMLKADPQKYPETLEGIKAINDICEIYDVTGNYYAILKVRTGSREELRSIIDKLGLIDGVISTETAIVLRQIKEDRIIRF